MLTGTQIREARALLKWSQGDLSRAAFLKLDIVDQAEEREGNALLTYGQEIAIRRACVQAGIEFVDLPPSARLGKASAGSSL